MAEVGLTFEGVSGQEEVDELGAGAERIAHASPGCPNHESATEQLLPDHEPRGSLVVARGRVVQRGHDVRGAPRLIERRLAAKSGCRRGRRHW